MNGVEWYVSFDGDIVYQSSDIFDCIERREQLGDGRVTDTVK
jgi:hypothetical protein